MVVYGVECGIGVGVRLCLAEERVADMGRGLDFSLSDLLEGRLAAPVADKAALIGQALATETPARSTLEKGGEDGRQCEPSGAR